LHILYKTELLFRAKSNYFGVSIFFKTIDYANLNVR